MCSIHKGHCELPKASHGAIGGISCKDFSKNRRSGEQCSSDSIYLATTSPGKSAECMHGFISLLDTCPPDWFLLENSDELAENAQHQESLDLFVHDMGTRGFDVRVFTANACDYLLPQRRVRTYILGVLRPLRHFLLHDYTGFFATVHRLIQAFMCEPVPLADVLLADDDPIVEQVLAARKHWVPVNTLTTKELNEERQAWMSLGLRNLPGCGRVKAADKESQWFSRMPLRKRSCLEIVQHRFRAKVEQCDSQLQRAHEDAAKRSTGGRAARCVVEAAIGHAKA